jgi:uncharacterized membrane protein YiaA
MLAYPSLIKIENKTNSYFYLRICVFKYFMNVMMLNLHSQCICLFESMLFRKMKKRYSMSKCKKLCLVCIFLGGTGVWTQGFMFSKQVLYCLSHISSPFCPGYFGDEGFMNYLPRLAFRWDSLDFSLLSG